MQARRSRLTLAKAILPSGALVLVLLVLMSLFAPGARADAPISETTSPNAGCSDGVQSSGALYRICMPLFGSTPDLVVYAHGYMTPTSSLAIPPESTQLATVFNLLGYAFATTSYSTNGLAVKQGIADLVDLVKIYKATYPIPQHVYLVGISEGGLLTTLAVEQYPNVFSGGLAMCGPIGDFPGQINYLGDFRVTFDYFFPGTIPGSPISITPSLMNNWDVRFSTVISPAITNPGNALTVTQLMSVTGAAYDPTDFTNTVLSTTYSVLWYNIFASNDTRAKLNGQPFDNQTRVYVGSNDDARLNANIQRFSADVSALNELQSYYETTGRLSSPLVTMYTTGDQVVPAWQETLYRNKVIAKGRLPRYDNITLARYGHCNFQISEVQSAFNLLVDRVNNPPPFKLFAPIIVR